MRQAPFAALALTLALTACGANQAQVRSSAQKSRHRSIAVLPFDYRGGERNAAPQAGDAFERRLRADGFKLADRGKARNVYAASLDAKLGAFGDPARAAELARALGVSAIVVGACDNAFDRVQRIPAQTRVDPITRRQILIAPADTDRQAGVSLRVRLIDAAGGAILWEAQYSATLHHSALSQVADQAASVLHDQFTDALLQGRF